tara:strand:- start:5313 stop:5537 length:225 start_codon:yes stop_codon:yes gene_type:complete
MEGAGGFTNIYYIINMNKNKIQKEFILKVLNEIKKMDCSIVDCSGKLFKTDKGHIVLNPINSDWLLTRLIDSLS